MSKYSFNGFYSSASEVADSVKGTIDGRKVELIRVWKSHVAKNCIVMGSAFYNSYKTKDNTLSAFVVPRTNLRHFHTTLTYSDILACTDRFGHETKKNNQNLAEAFQYLKDIVTRHTGCLITDHGPHWQRLARELLEQKSQVYMNLHHTGTVIYRCYLA